MTEPLALHLNDWADREGVNVELVLRAIERGALPAVRIGRTTLIGWQHTWSPALLDPTPPPARVDSPWKAEISMLTPGELGGLTRLLVKACPAETTKEDLQRLAQALLASIDRRGLEGTIAVIEKARTKRSASQRARIVRLFEGRCAYCRKLCNKSTRKPHIDHIVPVSCGGSEDVNNLALACSQCNLLKRAAIGGLCPLCGWPGWEVGQLIHHPPRAVGDKPRQHRPPTRMDRDDPALKTFLRYSVRPGFPRWDEGWIIPATSEQLAAVSAFGGS